MSYADDLKMQTLVELATVSAQELIETGFWNVEAMPVINTYSDRMAYLESEYAEPPDEALAAVAASHRKAFTAVWRHQLASLGGKP